MQMRDQQQHSVLTVDKSCIADSVRRQRQTLHLETDRHTMATMTTKHGCTVR